MDKGEHVAAQPGETDRRRPDKQTGDKLGRLFRKGGPGGPGRKAGVPNKATVVVKEIARELILGNTVVVKRLRKDAEAGTMHPRVFVELLHYGYGVPKETMAVEGSDRMGFQIVLTGPPHDPLAEPVRVEGPAEPVTLAVPLAPPATPKPSPSPTVQRKAARGPRTAGSRSR